MQQTLLSLLALLIATLLSFNQQQASIRSQQQAVRAEMEMMALGVAMQTMEVVRARDFDAGMDEHSRREIIDDPKSTLTDISNFGKKYEKSENEYSNSVKCKIYYKNSGSKCDFIEEFDGTKGVVPFRLEKDEDFPFSVTIEVRYVDDDLDPPTDDDFDPPYPPSVKTLQKEVVISVQDDPPNGSPRLPEPIRYSQVISYP